VKSFAKSGALLSIAGVALSLACSATLVLSQSDSRQFALSLQQQGRNIEAESAWRSVLKEHPTDADAFANLGLLEAHQEHYKEAVTYYRKALALNPQLPGLRLNIGLSEFKGGDLRAAIRTFLPLLKMQPKSSPEAVRLSALIGLADYGLGDYTAAVPYLKEATANDPQNLPFRLALAHSCLSARQFHCVLDVYREILSLNAESAEADMLAGEALDEMRNHAAAIDQFRAAVKADPKFPEVHFGLGYLLWSQNQFEEAANEFKAELENVPDNAQALAFLADADMQIGKSEEALPLVEKAIRIDPRIERAHLDRGILQADANKREEALREFKAAEKLAPDDPNVHWRMARLYQSMGMKQQARIEFDKTSSLHKAENATIFSKLKAAQEKGKPAEEPTPLPADSK
jgi:tetratricopeptide (TPR) repeat protein